MQITLDLTKFKTFISFGKFGNIKDIILNHSLPNDKEKEDTIKNALAEFLPNHLNPDDEVEKYSLKISQNEEHKRARKLSYEQFLSLQISQKLNKDIMFIPTVEFPSKESLLNSSSELQKKIAKLKQLKELNNNI
jgi:hypothetical protein